MNSLSISIRYASQSDSDMIGVVGPASYITAYHDLWDRPEALAVHLQSFGKKAVSEFLSSPGCNVIVACRNETIVGFLTMKYESPNPITLEDGGVEIPRIYLLQGIQGQGVGKRLYDAAEQRARTDGKHYMWLDAMASAEKVVGVYKGWGFIKIGQSRFECSVRSGADGMMVLRKQLSNVS